MTRKLAISVPDDVAARLDQESNVSAFVTEAVRRRMASEQTRQALADMGHAVTDEAMALAQARMETLRATVTPELRQKAEELRDRIRSGRPW